MTSILVLDDRPENRELMEVVEVIRYDTARQMLQYALDRDDLVDNTGPSGLTAKRRNQMHAVRFVRNISRTALA